MSLLKNNHNSSTTHAKAISNYVQFKIIAFFMNKRINVSTVLSVLYGQMLECLLESYCLNKVYHKSCLDSVTLTCNLC
jgi:hypothetical protein